MAKNYSNVEEFIFICYGKDCKKEGCKKIKNGVESGLKKKKLNKKVKIIKTKCTNRCSEAPIVIFRNNWIGNATEEKIFQIADS